MNCTQSTPRRRFQIFPSLTSLRTHELWNANWVSRYSTNEPDFLLNTPFEKRGGEETIVRNKAGSGQGIR